MESLAPAFAVPAMFLIIGWVVRSIVAASKEEKLAELQAQLHGRVLDRCQSSDDIASYFDSGLGDSLRVSSVTERGVTLNKVLSSLRSSVVLVSLGAGLLLMRDTFTDPSAHEGFVVFGGLTLALGLGFLVASVLSYLLSKSWGLLDGAELPSERAAQE